jgi:AraC-like DNA-binding protein
MENSTDKTFFLEALRDGLARHGGRLAASAMPPVFCTDSQKGPQPWFRLVIGLRGPFEPGYYNGDYRTAPLNDGGLLTVPPNCYLAPSGIQGGEHIQIIFRDHYIRYLRHRNNINFWYHTRSPVRAEGMQIIRGLNALSPSARFDAVRLNLATTLIQWSILELEDDIPAAHGKAYRTYSRALEFILENLPGELSRRRTARAAGVTESHLSRLFMEFRGMDFLNTVKRFRLERAALLLRQTALSIKEVAGLCGFKSDRHFIREFKRFHGATPGRCRDGGEPS